MSQLSWMLGLIPDSFFVWVTYTLMIIGAGLYVASKLVTWIPLMSQYKLPSELIGLIEIAEEKSAQVNTVIKEKIVYKTKVIKQKEIEYIDRIKEVEKIIDAKCEIDPAAIDILNKAALDPTKEKVK